MTSEKMVSRSMHSKMARKGLSLGWRCVLVERVRQRSLFLALRACSSIAKLMESRFMECSMLATRSAYCCLTMWLVSIFTYNWLPTAQQLTQNSLMRQFITILLAYCGFLSCGFSSSSGRDRKCSSLGGVRNSQGFSSTLILMTSVLGSLVFPSQTLPILTAFPSLFSSSLSLMLVLSEITLLIDSCLNNFQIRRSLLYIFALGLFRNYNRYLQNQEIEVSSSYCDRLLSATLAVMLLMEYLQRRAFSRKRRVSWKARRRAGGSRKRCNLGRICCRQTKQNQSSSHFIVNSLALLGRMSPFTLHSLQHQTIRSAHPRIVPAHLPYPNSTRSNYFSHAPPTAFFASSCQPSSTRTTLTSSSSLLELHTSIFLPRKHMQGLKQRQQRRYSCSVSNFSNDLRLIACFLRVKGESLRQEGHGCT